VTPEVRSAHQRRHLCDPMGATMLGRCGSDVTWAISATIGRYCSDVT
jgi:hypothetical protein